MPKISHCLWFDGQAEEAMRFYVSVFDDSKVIGVTRYGEAGPGAPGTVMTASFVIAGQEFFALNGGPEFIFSPAISIVVNCDTQEELDRYWERLSAGGETIECGWLKDKYGVSWQVVPSAWPEWLSAADPVRAQRVMKAMMQMVKLDIATLQQAYEGG
jgi:predicted 3-demethylubiquinone-9 3-methyltransferase (glyoxalase superfamily)